MCCAQLLGPHQTVLGDTGPGQEAPIMSHAPELELLELEDTGLLEPELELSLELEDTSPFEPELELSLELEE